MIVLGIAGTILIVLLFLWNRKKARFHPLYMTPHYPIIGASMHLEIDGHKFFKQMRRYAEESNFLFVIWFFMYPTVWVGQVKFAEFVLRSNEVITKSFLYDQMHPWLGTGLLTDTTTHQKWKSRRRAITPSFHFSILNDFQKIFLKQAQTFASKLKTYSEKGEAFDIQIPVGLVTLDIICETAMGVSVNAQDEEHSEYVKAIGVSNLELQNRMKFPWLWPDFIYYRTSYGKLFQEKLKILHGFTANVINEKISARKESKNVPNGTGGTAFMDMLLELYEKDEIDVEGIREEVDTFMFEGHDTTAAGLSWTLYLLGLNPEVQEKLHAEIDESASKDGDLIEKIKGLKYLEYVLKEGLRLHPPVTNFGRDLEHDTIIEGINFPKGTSLIIDTLSLHTNPEYWDEPLKFNPERFADEKFLKRNPYCYVPFSAGPRNCIGQKFAMLEEKILLYHVMVNFKVESFQKEEDVHASIALIHNSENGLLVKLTPRQI